MCRCPRQVRRNEAMPAMRQPQALLCRVRGGGCCRHALDAPALKCPGRRQRARPRSASPTSCRSRFPRLTRDVVACLSRPAAVYPHCLNLGSRCHHGQKHPHVTANVVSTPRLSFAHARHRHGSMYELQENMPTPSGIRQGYPTNTTQPMPTYISQRLSHPIPFQTPSWT